MRRRQFLATPLLLLASHAARADDYPHVLPGYALRFPRDFGSHPAFRTEWWYITGWVRSPDGRDYGIQITFFRNRPRLAESNPSRFAPHQLLFAHAALADPKYGRLRHSQRAARAGFDLAHAAENTTDVWVDDWSLKRGTDKYIARIAADDFEFELEFASTQALLLEGEAGYSRKAPTPLHASYYYSEPQLAVSGAVAVDGKKLPVTGRAWLDHEWSSESLSTEASGWDWVGINLHDGGALMAFRIRDRSGAQLWAGATHRTKEGITRVFTPKEVHFMPVRQWRSPRTQVDYPTGMQLGVAGVAYQFQALINDQEFDSRSSTGTIYWEGAVRALSAGREVGHGYLELTGYWRPLRL